MWGYRVIIPQKLRKEILQQLHLSHLGIVKTKALARSYIWWPKVDDEIENLIKNCDACQKYSSSPEKSSLIPLKPTELSWQRIHIDFAGPIKGYLLFVIVDSYSKWVEVFKTKDSTSDFVVSKLRETFCRFGIVDTIVSDNGRQFVSDKFKEFIQKNKIRHVRTSPGHPATNGQAENFVKTLKKSLYASFANQNETDFDIILNRFLMDYRNTEHCVTGETPAKIFLGRSVKTRFDLIKPPLVKDTIVANQETATENFKGKRNVCFKKGQRVYIRDYRNPNKAAWMPAIIKEKLGTRSYDCIISHDNNTIKRHTDQIKNGANEEICTNNSSDACFIPEEEANTLVETPQSYSGYDNDVEIQNNVNLRKLRPRVDGKVLRN